MMKFLFTLLLLFIIDGSIHTLPINDLICKVQTCRDFYHGLEEYPRQKQYEEICSETVSTLQSIPRRYGKCINDRTGQINAPCIYALADTIKKCIRELNDIPETKARFYCGYTLMKYCAVHLGLDGLPLRFKD